MLNLKELKNNFLFQSCLAIFELWPFLNYKRKRQVATLLLMMIIGGLCEAISLGALMPFLAAIAAPEKILSHSLVRIESIPLFPYLSALAKYHNLTPTPDALIILFLSSIFIFSAILTGTFRLLLVWFSASVAYGIGSDLGVSIYQKVLHQPYKFHISYNSSSIISKLTVKVSLLILTISNFLLLITSSVISIFIALALLTLAPAVTFGLIILLVIAYGLTAWICNSMLKTNSLVMAKEQDAAVKALQEGLGGIRDILLDKSQEIFCGVYKKADSLMRRANANLTAISHSPRHVMESAGIVLFGLLAIKLTAEPKGLLVALPTLGLLALGVQRLLPALQMGFTGWSTIVGYEQSTKEVLELLRMKTSLGSLNCKSSSLVFNKEISFESVGFHYTKDSPIIFKDLSFTIAKGSKVGFVGKTGSGKSTCLDLLMGLLEPTKGKILIDGHALAPSNIAAWQQNIAHVPQAVYLADNSLAENIAFGVPFHQIDLEKVKKAAKQAQIADFIESSSAGYWAIVGERGVRLSGGQRQRLGIARALYKKAKLLILDEATSALDLETEKMVMMAVDALTPRITVLIIAHRLSTLAGCNNIVELNPENINSK